MTLRIGTLGGYVIAFSLTGLLLCALQLLANIIWLAMPPANDVSSTTVLRMHEGCRHP